MKLPIFQGVADGSFRLEPQITTWSFPDGLPTMVDPAGLSIELGIEASEGYEIDSSTARMILSRPTGTTTSALAQTGPTTFVATFPPMPCGDEISYSFRVLTTSGELSTAPAGGSVSALVASESIDDLDALALVGDAIAVAVGRSPDREIDLVVAAVLVAVRQRLVEIANGPAKPAVRGLP